MALLIEHFNWEDQHYQFYVVPIRFERQVPAQILFKIKIALDKLITTALIKDVSVTIFKFFLTKAITK